MEVIPHNEPYALTVTLLSLCRSSQIIDNTLMLIKIIKNTHKTMAEGGQSSIYSKRDKKTSAIAPVKAITRPITKIKRSVSILLMKGFCLYIFLEQWAFIILGL